MTCRVPPDQAVTTYGTFNDRDHPGPAETDRGTGMTDDDARGDKVEQDEPTPVPHDYLSTACVHDLHNRCRQRCKYCWVPCNCPCH